MASRVCVSGVVCRDCMVTILPVVFAISHAMALTIGQPR